MPHSQPYALGIRKARRYFGAHQLYDAFGELARVRVDGFPSKSMGWMPRIERRRVKELESVALYD